MRSIVQMYVRWLLQVYVREAQPTPGFLLEVASVMSGLNAQIYQGVIQVGQAGAICFWCMRANLHPRYHGHHQHVKPCRPAKGMERNEDINTVGQRQRRHAAAHLPPLSGPSPACMLSGFLAHRPLHLMALHNWAPAELCPSPLPPSPCCHHIERAPHADPALPPPLLMACIHLPLSTQRCLGWWAWHRMPHAGLALPSSQRATLSLFLSFLVFKPWLLLLHRNCFCFLIKAKLDIAV
jgi:hypothetical protein